MKTNDPSGEYPAFIGRLESPTFTQQLLILHRYFSWADAMRENYEIARKRDIPLIEKARAEGKSYPYHLAMQTEMYMCYWFSTLYIVIEGWPRLKYHDPRLEELLPIPGKKKLLKDFRDAIFHPSDWMDKRIKKLVQQGEESYNWVVAVTDAYRDFFTYVRELDEALGMEGKVD